MAPHDRPLLRRCRQLFADRSGELPRGVARGRVGCDVSASRHQCPPSGTARQPTHQVTKQGAVMAHRRSVRAPTRTAQEPRSSSAGSTVTYTYRRSRPHSTSTSQPVSHPPPTLPNRRWPHSPAARDRHPTSTPNGTSSAVRFAHEWQGKTRERGEAQTFWGEFLSIFGINRRRVNAAFERFVRVAFTSRPGHHPPHAYGVHPFVTVLTNVLGFVAGHGGSTSRAAGAWIVARCLTL